MNISILFKTSAVLWVVWGIVHALAGIIVLSSDATEAVKAIADGVDASQLDYVYPEAAGAIINQHGWNLLWFGLATFVGAILIWRQNQTSVWVTALIGGFADIGYFIFLDLGGFVHFMPGTLMTIFSASAILISFFAVYKLKA